MHQVLNISEILAIIFETLENPELLACALTCKAWHDLALNELWYEINDLSKLFKLLGEMGLDYVDSFQDSLDALDSGSRSERMDDTKPVYNFSPSSDALRWERFELYAHKVKELHHLDFELPHTISDKVFKAVALKRPSLHILPKLKLFEWFSETCLSNGVLFMHPNLATIHLHLDQGLWSGPGDTDSVQSANDILNEAADRLPSMTCLDISASFFVDEVESSLVRLLQRASCLESIVLPRFWMTDSIVTALSQLSKLRSFGYVHQELQFHDLRNFNPVIPSGSFRALKELSLEVSLDQAANVLASVATPTSLQDFYLRTTFSPSPSTFYNFLASHVSKLQFLEFLKIDLFQTNPEDTNSKDYVISSDDIMPLLLIPSLKGLGIMHHNPLNLSFEFVEQLAQAFPSLQEVLSLYLDGNLPLPPLDFRYPKFKSIQHIELGHSPLGKDQTKDVAFFISRLISPAISDGVNGWVDVVSSPCDDLQVSCLQTDETRQAVLNYRGEWGKVDESLRLIQETRILENPMYLK
ncbi:hypothetical protein M422DRAFT_40789 [Sphaerobolus stellatus SS14]|nr:hypothetical protein M422DRAFT_40789 [Sphaerobolus stellatus SS14]